MGPTPPGPCCVTGSGTEAAAAPGDAPPAPAGRTPRVLAIGLLGLGLALRLATIGEDPLHPDECLYASWAAAVWPGGDWLLRGEVIDKPPLFPYLLMAWSQLVGPGPAALRLLGAASSLVGLLCVFRIARTVAGEWAGLAALCLASLSPVAVALDASAFTDPPAVALALASVMVAGLGRTTGAGLLLGLALAAKPTALAFLPLALVMGPARGRRATTRLLGGVAAVMVMVLVWEWARAPEVGFVAAALRHYGVGQDVAPDGSGWAALLRWIWGRPSMGLLWGLVVVAGGAAAWRRWTPPGRLLAGSLAAGVLYLAFQALLSAPAWDRYLLPLVPLAALAVAGGIGALEKRFPRGPLPLGAVAGLLALLLLLAPAQEAAQGRLPLGNTSAYQGIESVAAYLRAQVPGRATVLYRDLGWHIRYYMAGFTQDFIWYQERERMLSVAESADPVLLLAVAGTTADEDVAQLRRSGWRVTPSLNTYRHDGTPALVLYLLAGEGR